MNKRCRVDLKITRGAHCISSAAWLRRVLLGSAAVFVYLLMDSFFRYLLLPRSNIPTPNHKCQQFSSWTIHSNSFQNMTLISNGSANLCFSGGCKYFSKKFPKQVKHSEIWWHLKGNGPNYGTKLYFSGVQVVCQDCGVCVPKEHKADFLLEFMIFEELMLWKVCCWKQ